MGKNYHGIETQNSKSDDGKSQQMSIRIGKELSRSEIPKCNEGHDIRDKVVSGDPFTSSPRKRLKAEKTAIKGEFGEALNDENLHCDTTRPSESGKIGKAPQAKDSFTKSASSRNADERSKKRTFSAEGTSKDKQMNS